MILRRKTLVGAVGLAAGAAIAIGVPWAVLVHGKSAGLSSTTLVVLSLVGIGSGVLLGALSVVFSIVTPSRDRR